MRVRRRGGSSRSTPFGRGDRPLLPRGDAIVPSDVLGGHPRQFRRPRGKGAGRDGTFAGAGEDGRALNEDDTGYPPVRDADCELRCKLNRRYLPRDRKYRARIR